MRTTCPHCNRKIEIVVRPVGGAAQPAPGGLFGRLLGTNRYEFAAQKFHQTAAPAVTFQRQEEPRGTPVDVEPGQTHTTETYRAPVAADVLVPGMWAGIGGVLLGAGSIFPTVAWGWPWYAPFGVWLGSTAALWFAASTRILSRSSLLTYVEELTRLDLDGDGRIGDEEPPAYVVRGELVGERNSLYVEHRVHNREAWYRFCAAVAAGANFSERFAVSCGMEPAEFKAVVSRWASWDEQKALIDPASVGERLRLRLTPLGVQMVRLFATTPPDAVGD